MERNENSFSSSRKRRNPENPESQFDVMKQENERLKELIKQQQNLIGKQALKIYRLKEENDYRLVEVDDADGKAVEEELRSKNSELEQKLENEKTKFEKELAELKDQIVNFEKQTETKNEKIKDLEEQLSTILSIKSDPDYSTEAMQNRIDELESSCNLKVKELEAQYQISEEEKTLLRGRCDELQSSCKEFEKIIKELEAQLESKTNIETYLQSIICQLKQDSVEHRKFFDSEIGRLKAENDELKSNVENLTKKISEEQNSATLMQSKVDELNGIITVAKEKEEQQKSKIEELNEELRSKNSELEQRIEEYRNAQLQSENSARFLTLDQFRRGVVIKVAKVVVCTYWSVKLYSSLDPNEEPVEFEFQFQKSHFKLQLHGELKIGKNHNFANIMNFFHSSTIKKLDFGSTSLSYSIFMKLVSTYKFTTFICGCVFGNDYYNRKYFGIDEIMKELPHIEIFEMRRVERAEDCEKLVELPIFSNLQKFTVCLDDPLFDLTSFVPFIKKHQNARFIIKFEKLRRHEKKKMPTKLTEFRKLIPSTCKIVFEY